MTIAIMQPYLFPYLGYFQLIAAADRFVIYDDVDFSSGAWSNRNRLLDPTSLEPFWMTVPTRSRRGLIAEMEIGWQPVEQEKLLRRIKSCYARAPQFDRAWPVVREVFDFPAKKLGPFLRHSLEAVCEYMSITTPLVESSSAHGGTRNLRGLDRVLEIVRREGSDIYLNAEGGRALYPPDPFREAGIELKFLEHIERPYAQHPGIAGFVPRLSIIDAMMYHPLSALREMLLSDFTITDP